MKQKHPTDTNSERSSLNTSPLKTLWCAERVYQRHDVDEAPSQTQLSQLQRTRISFEILSEVRKGSCESNVLKHSHQGTGVSYLLALDWSARAPIEHANRPALRGTTHEKDPAPRRKEHYRCGLFGRTLYLLIGIAPFAIREISNRIEPKR